MYLVPAQCTGRSSGAKCAGTTTISHDRLVDYLTLMTDQVIENTDPDAAADLLPQATEIFLALYTVTKEDIRIDTSKLADLASYRKVAH